MTTKTRHEPAHKPYRPRGSTLADRYLALLLHVTRNGFSKDGRRFFSLTDMEAAAWLSRTTRRRVERTSINPTRAVLMEAGRVGKAGRRRCFVTGSEAGTYAATTGAARAEHETATLFD